MITMPNKLPVILQMEMTECGAASLAMLMAYYGKWVPLEQLRTDCGVSRDGSTARGILMVARLYGFTAQGFQVEPEHILENADLIGLPCILHWNMNHFVVLRKLTKKYAYINDPAKGEVRVTLEQFNASFTGVAVDIRPGPDFEKSGKPVSVWPFAKQRLRGTGPIFVFVSTIATLATILGIYNTLFSRVFIDDLLSGIHPEWAFAFMALYFAFNFIYVLLSFLNTKINFKLAAKFAATSSSMFVWHALRLPVDFYASRNAGDIAMRQQENDKISMSLIQLFAPLFLNAVTMIFYLFIVLRYSVLLTLIGLSSLIINYAVNQYITKKNIDISRVSARDSGKLKSVTISGMENIETIKASGAEDGFFEKWSGYHASVVELKVKSTRLNLFIGLIPLIITDITNIAVLITGAWLIMEGHMTIGIFYAFQGFLTLFLSPFSKILTTRLDMQKTKISMERVQDVFNYKTDVQYADFEIDESVAKLSGNVEVKDLSFGYNRLAGPLLSDFSMSLKPGGSVALVGASGCGKSTIAKLICNLYKPWSGEILFDGKPCADMPREIFTSSVSVVDQDITLFQDKVNSNLKMWDRSIEDFEMIMAARDAQIHGAIIEREDGYDSEIMENGKNFSGGERQRLEIAGALAREPSILILDEATSALDTKTEQEFIQAVKGRGISMIVIAHRLSTIRDCDEIIVLDKGKVVERGSHDELFAAGGKYRELVVNA